MILSLSSCCLIIESIAKGVIWRLGGFPGLPVDVKAMLFASCGAKGDFFTTDFFSGNIFGQQAVSFQHHLDCFIQISPRLLDISAERDRSRKLSDRGLNQPIGLFIDYGHLDFHEFPPATS